MPLRTHPVFCYPDLLLADHLISWYAFSIFSYNRRRFVTARSAFLYRGTVPFMSSETSCVSRFITAQCVFPAPQHLGPSAKGAFKV
jgi:hypothetical protein